MRSLIAPFFSALLPPQSKQSSTFTPPSSIHLSPSFFLHSSLPQASSRGAEPGAEAMGDRAYAPATTKPVPVRATNGAANGVGPPRPAPPPMVPGRVPPPPMYRPKPAQSRPPPRRPRRSARGWCCACCLWLTLVLVGLIFLGAITAGVFYVVYHPQLPTFAVTSLRLAALNVSDSDAVTSRIEFTVTARNPNDKIAFAYGDIAASFEADGADVGDGVVPGFLHPAGNTTVIRAAATAAAATVDPVQAAALRSKKSHAMSAEMDSKVGFQIGRLKSKRINVRVLCAGFSAGLAKPTAPVPAPTVEVAAAPAPVRARPRSPRPPRSVVRTSSTGGGGGNLTTTDAKCKLRVKIWIWTF
uniref:Late embryogenesis abundant protein LEA-2 subgroup domain-containing protein n=1 Tax=Arundo donax TaxID=35708 RepID=A0A0A9DJP4_ARUDO